MIDKEITDQKHFFAEHYFATIEELEEALKDEELKELYDKNFAEEKEEK